ncbi:putative lipoprotein [Candidatus Erwinia dacicola]|uniref:Lipoprotein n=1 Tax=Candidatus Erwinia dacicola TaxID=252393 RepID=A0A328TNR9_9GAMM|nr:putative lipoprotein [Candidatus Erwinia dacicola]
MEPLTAALSAVAAQLGACQLSRVSALSDAQMAQAGAMLAP